MLALLAINHYICRYLHLLNMTAIVGVLNKHAVAIAADSAVTMGNTHKVINCANKIFTLSKYHPVAVMTYNTASFMDIPWDIIIKEYRRQLKDTGFAHLRDYMDDFIAYLHKRNFFCDDETQKKNLRRYMEIFLSVCIHEIRTEKGLKEDAPINPADMEAKLKSCGALILTSAKCPETASYSLGDFKKFALSDIQEMAKKYGIADTDFLAEFFYHYLTAQFSSNEFTGLIFTGYGEEEIFPSLISTKVNIGIDKFLKYYIDDKVEITQNGTQASIIPFAQIDVTQTIVRGIRPVFQEIITNVFSKTITDYSNVITGILDKNPLTASLSSAIKGLDLTGLIKNAATQINHEFRNQYTEPLINTVVLLDKEDMANMAESFISLTSLVRRMTPGEETVGGPVDVAVISKGDGFIWIKRKHYFAPELNAPFFSNYFK